MVEDKHVSFEAVVALWTLVTFLITLANSHTPKAQIPRALLLADADHLLALSIISFWSRTNDLGKRCLLHNIDVWHANRCIQYIRNWLMLFKNLVRDLISVWVIRIRCQYFKLSVSDLNLNSVWVIWIRCEWFEFGVSNLNSVWVIWIWCEWFEFSVSNLNSVWVI